MLFQFVRLPCRLNVLSLACLFLFSLAGGFSFDSCAAFPVASKPLQDNGSSSRFDQRIDELKKELARQQRVLGSRHPRVRELQVELQVRMKHLDQEQDEVSRKMIGLEIDLAKAQLQFSGNHPEVKSLRKQILLWQQYSKQERVGSNELVRLDTAIEALRIELVMSGNLGAGHPLVKDLRKEFADVQMERNVLGMQEECERQKLHIWRSEIDRKISARAKQSGISPEQWLTQKSRAAGIGPDKYRQYVIWRELALEKLATLESPLQDKKLQGLVDSFRNSQKPDQQDP
ncbi:MAG: hypothetical protein P8K79_05810 [Mariniblastus sp.]|nr:hypothetical protein [Mariniblastus sp.]